MLRRAQHDRIPRSSQAYQGIISYKKALLN